jgi:hypothetical protein
LLQSEGVDISECKGNITDFYVAECPNVKIIDMLQGILNTDGHALKRVRAIGFDETFDNGDVLTAIAKLASGKYQGLTSDGKAQEGLPVLQGTMHVNAFVYEDDVNAIEEAFRGDLKLFITGGYYMRFADPEVLKVLLANGVGDGVGITTEQAAAVTSIGTWFKGNTAITSFDEFERFTGVTSLVAGAYQGCTSLSSIKVPNGVTAFNQNSFNGCGALTSFTTDWSKIVTIGLSAFQNCTSLAIEDLSLPYLTDLGQNAFYGVKIKKISNLGKVTSLQRTGTTYGDKTTLESLNLPQTIKSLGSDSGGNTFDGFINLVIEDVNFPSVTYIPDGVFYNTKINKLTSLGSSTAISQTNAQKSQKGAFQASTINEVAEGVFDNITTIGSYAFTSATMGGGEAELIFPNVKTIGYFAFQSLKVKKITFGSLTKIPGEGYSFACFRYCTMTEMDLPDTLTEIQQYGLYECRNLTTLIIRATNPPTLGSNAFTGTPSTMPSTMTIYVPDGSVEAYKTATNWSTYANRIKPLSEYTEE